MWAVPRLCELYPGICLTLRKKHELDWKSLWIIRSWRNLENLNRIYLAQEKAVWTNRPAQGTTDFSRSEATVIGFSRTTILPNLRFSQQYCWRFKSSVILLWSTLCKVAGDSNYYLLYLLSFFSVFQFIVEYRGNINKFTYKLIYSRHYS